MFRGRIDGQVAVGYIFGDELPEDVRSYYRSKEEDCDVEQSSASLLPGSRLNGPTSIGFLNVNIVTEPNLSVNELYEMVNKSFSGRKACSTLIQPAQVIKNCSPPLLVGPPPVVMDSAPAVTVSLAPVLEFEDLFTSASSCYAKFAKASINIQVLLLSILYWIYSTWLASVSHILSSLACRLTIDKSLLPHLSAEDGHNCDMSRVSPIQPTIWDILNQPP